MTDMSDEIGQQLFPELRMDNFGVELNAIQLSAAVGDRGDGRDSREVEVQQYSARSSRNGNCVYRRWVGWMVKYLK